MKPVRIVIIAKAPIPGFCKTRLVPALGTQGAADLASHMLTHTLQQCLEAAIGPVELCVTPSVSHAAWRSVIVPPEVCWSEQGEGDLGDRLARVSERVIAAGEAILLVGTDCPQLDCARLQTAARALQQSDAVITPTADGGYALLGFRQFCPLIFANIAWSTNTVAATTFERIDQLCWTVARQPGLHDIDEPKDLEWLPAGWPRVAHR